METIWVLAVLCRYRFREGFGVNARSNNSESSYAEASFIVPISQRPSSFAMDLGCISVALSH